jgi:hypothetical protein
MFVCFRFLYTLSDCVYVIIDRRHQDIQVCILPIDMCNRSRASGVFVSLYKFKHDEGDSLSLSLFTQCAGVCAGFLQQHGRPQ